jgi:hypothetical protein
LKNHDENTKISLEDSVVNFKHGIKQFNLKKNEKDVKASILKPSFSVPYIFK